MADQFEINVLADGSIKVETEGISEENHMLVDQFFAFIAQKAGGKVTREAKESLGHVHQHNGIHHKH